MKAPRRLLIPSLVGLLALVVIGAPSFTVQDVLDYKDAHPFAAMRAEAAGKPKLAKI